MGDRDGLTGREGEIARAYAAGASNTKIADDFCISPSTVRTHINSVYRKLGVSSKIELLRKLENDGLMGPDGAAETATLIQPETVERSWTPGRRWVVPLAVLVGFAILFAVMWQTRPPLVTEAQTNIPFSVTPVSNPSVAVFPLDTDVSDQRQERFARAVSRDLVTDLAQFSSFFVFSSDTTFKYAESGMTAGEIGRNLGARYVVFGDLQWHDNAVRANVQVLATETSEVIWAHRFEGMQEDLPVLQTEMVSSIASQLGSIEVGAGRLREAEFERISRAPTGSLQAYDYYLRGWELYGTFNIADNQRARAEFQKAVEADPDFAKAHAMLAWTFLYDMRNDLTVPADVSLARADAHAGTAVGIDDTEPFAHWSLGAVRLYQRRHAASLAAFKKALALNPGNAELMTYVGWALTYIGDPGTGIQYLEEAIRRNPAHPGWYYWDLAFAHFVAKDYGVAAEVLERRSPKTVGTHKLLAIIYAMDGREEDAAVEVARVQEHGIDASVQSSARLEPFAHEKDLEHYLDAMRRAGFPE